jgi:hypothetical protein
LSFRVRFHTIPSENTEPLSAMSGWTKWAFFMLVGSAIGKAFYYIGVPPAKIFIGDVVLFLFFMLRPRESWGTWARFLMRKSEFGAFSWILLISVIYGVFEVICGLYYGYPLLAALELLVFNIYPAYLFLGLWAGGDHVNLIRKLFRFYGWWLAIYGPAYLLYLHKVPWTMPGSDVPIFGQPGGGGMIILALLALERKPSKYWFLIVMSAIMLLAVQVRAEWISTMVAFALWGFLERKMTKVLSIAALVVVLLGVGYAADVDIPSPAQRGGAVSSREIVARGLAAISPTLAQEYTDSKDVGFYAGTISWRTRWWNAIWDSVNQSLTSMAFGNGYGFPLKNLVPYLKTLNLRTPHSIFFFALGYSGWIGVLLFFSLQLALAASLWHVYKLTGQSFGLAMMAATITSSLFGDLFESPMGAIPYFLMIGLYIGPILRRHQAAEYLEQADAQQWEPLPAMHAAYTSRVPDSPNAMTDPELDLRSTP